jgi:Zn-dependent peptidase ImmA (M78 family)
VPFREKEELESVASSTLEDLAYSTGQVPLADICAAESRKTGLTVHLDVQPTADIIERQVLGRILFNPSRIEVFTLESPNPGRARFTLAHELAHHLLGHGKHMTREYCQQADFSLKRSSRIEGTNVARMEFQANYLAASLLLPKQNIVADFRTLVRDLDLPNRGFGPLYVDDQACNLQGFEVVLGHVTRKYGVSRTAATIRLQSLGLLKDARKPSVSLNPLQALASWDPT